MRSCLPEKKVSLGLAGILLGALACATLSPAVQTPTSPQAPIVEPPTSTAFPETSVPLYQQVTMSTVQTEEHSQLSDYAITAQLPRLTGSDDSRVSAFNDEMAGIVSQAVVEFKQNLAGMLPTPVNAASSFDVRYSLLSPPGDLYSMKFEMLGYVTGAAHPYHLSRTANFDLAQGKDLVLADLFRPGSNYLEVISAYCISQLETRDLGFEATNPGAAPTLENYRNWNITMDGLMITFDEYQVAAYAAGPQVVVIPYADLARLIQTPGLLTPYLP
jgi:hypothetical protein